MSSEEELAALVREAKADIKDVLDILKDLSTVRHQDIEVAKSFNELFLVIEELEETIDGMQYKPEWD